MKKIFTCTLLVITLLLNVQAQTPPTYTRCATTEYIQQQVQANPEYRKLLDKAEIQSQEWERTHPGGTRPTITIPTVVHVVWRVAAENISDAQILSQIDVMNEDYGRTNADASQTPSQWTSISVNTGVQFCLAVRDPNGNATTGIVRRQTTSTSFSTNDAVKYTSQGGDDAWDRNSYLNVWVCNLGGGLLGYGTFPGGPAAVDGTVMLYSAFGRTGNVVAPYDLGRTATHEIGHWFSLYHIWGDDGGACSGSDQVADTPNQADATTTCPGFPLTDGCTATSPGVMFMNYMDYSYDNCLNMFTNGQKTRIQSTMNGARVSILSSQGCVPVSTLTRDAGVSAVVSPTGSACTATITPVLTIKNFATVALTSCTVNYKIDAGAPVTQAWTGSLASGATANVTFPTVTATGGAHTLKGYTTNPNAGTDMLASNDTTTATFTIGATGLSLPFAYGFEPTTFPPTNWTLNNPDASTTWVRTTAAFRTGTASAYMHNATYNANNQLDDLNLPGLNLSGSNTALLTFQVAYRLWTNPTSTPNFSDTLRLFISTDCGNTWTQIYNKYGTNLVTTAAPSYQASEFVPTSAQWRMESVDLTPYISSSNAMIRFRNITDYENNMYIDDINITSTTDMNRILADNSLEVFPNPATDALNIKFELPQEENVTVQLVNVLGQTIIMQKLGVTTNGNFSMNLDGINSGVFFIRISTPDYILNRKVSKQ